MADLLPEAFDKLRSWIRIDNPNHPWLDETNEGIIHSAELIMEDPETGKDGLTLAAILLFGNEHAISKAVPHYRIDALYNVSGSDLYDDRDIIKCNLIFAYERLMAFIKKHLSEIPFIEDNFRISLRDKILREVVLNILIHSEYSSLESTTFTIERDRITARNFNVPYIYGSIDMKNTKPHRKNPHIANVFSQTIMVEELGSGMKRIFKYTPLFAKGQMPEIFEDDYFTIIIPRPLLVSDTNNGASDTNSDTNNGASDTNSDTNKATPAEVIMNLIKENSTISAAQMAEHLGINRRNTLAHLKKLQESGRIKRVGKNKSGHWEVIDSSPE